MWKWREEEMLGGIKHRFYSLWSSFISLPKDLILKVLLRDTWLACNERIYLIVFVLCRWSVCQREISSLTLSDIWLTGSRNLDQLKTVRTHSRLTSVGSKYHFMSSSGLKFGIFLNVQIWNIIERCSSQQTKFNCIIILENVVLVLFNFIASHSEMFLLFRVEAEQTCT